MRIAYKRKCVVSPVEHQCGQVDLSQTWYHQVCCLQYPITDASFNPFLVDKWIFNVFSNLSIEINIKNQFLQVYSYSKLRSLVS